MADVTGQSSLALCICTIDRADVLKRCLESIFAGTARPDAILVSDDSADGGAVAAVCEEFPGVTYIKGPRRGLCANRNWVIRQATTTHVSLVDDDSVISPDFVADAKAIIARSPENMIITGIVIEAGLEVVPFNSSFLGHFGRRPKNRFENVNLNCNVFPRRAFDYASFDEAIAYGYEDMDLCSRLLFFGFRIQFERELRNTHLPPARTASVEKVRFLRTERARFYTSVKRYMLWERDYVRLAVYLVVAPVHRALHAVKGGLWFDLKHCLPDMVAAFKGALRERGKLKRFADAAPKYDLEGRISH